MPTTAHLNNNAPGTVVCGSPGSGKAIWDNEQIITPNGRKQIKDIKIGDMLFGKNAKLNSNGIILVYSVIDKKSFDNVNSNILEKKEKYQMKLKN